MAYFRLRQLCVAMERQLDRPKPFFRTGDGTHKCHIGSVVANKSFARIVVQGKRYLVDVNAVPHLEFSVIGTAAPRRLCASPLLCGRTTTHLILSLFRCSLLRGRFKHQVTKNGRRRNRFIFFIFFKITSRQQCSHLLILYLIVSSEKARLQVRFRLIIPFRSKYLYAHETPYFTTLPLFISDQPVAVIVATFCFSTRWNHGNEIAFRSIHRCLIFCRA